MVIEAVQHISDSSYAYAVDDNSLMIKIRVKKDDMDKVYLYYGDRYEPSKVLTMYKKEMNISYRDNLFDYYEIKLSPDFNKIAYYFELIDGEKKVIYSQGRFYEKPPKERNQYYIFSYICKADLYSGYKWWQNMIVYQIFVDRFYKEGIDKSWYRTPTSSDVYGGNLKGILDKLNYLEELGINSIYLTPIFESPTCHKYDTVDYYKIDKSFGDKEIFRKLICECHKRGIKIILDAVFNHTSSKFFAFKDVLEKGSKSKYYNWYLFKDDNTYECFGSSKTMPKLNTNCKEAADYVIGVAKYWIKEFDIDGWRLDVANEIDHKFWRRFREEVKSVKKDVFIVGEAWDGGESYLNGDQYDSIMNYPYMYALIDYFGKNSITLKKFNDYVNNLFVRYRKPIRNQMLNLIDSHDTSRFLYECGEDIEKFKMAVFFEMTSIGMPMVYYGDELEMTGSGDPYCRKTINFEEGNKELFNYYKKLISIRKSSNSLKYGEFKTIYADNDIYAYNRFTDNEEVLCIFNNSSNSSKVELCIDGNSTVDLLSNIKYPINKNKLNFEVKPYGKYILRLHK